MGDDTKHNDPARAEGKDLKITYQVRVLDPDDPKAEDLHRRQIRAMAAIIRHATLKREREARESEGEPGSPAGPS
ncbi:MAG: hypothetical protein JSS68_20365 [Actinobacteria bacterium]|nr:hypothetical protein [Actinomycetota bacterium]